VVILVQHKQETEKMSESLTIAQALRRVKKLKGLVAEHQTKAKNGVSYVADKVPAFRFGDEMTAIAEAIAEMVDLESRIAIANATSQVQEGDETLTLAKAIRTLQEIKGYIAFYQGLLLRDGVEKTRESDWDEDSCKSISRVVETTYVSDLSEQARDRRVKDLQNRFETLNNLVEDANHKVLV
jgi:hypothetical protein